MKLFLDTNALIDLVADHEPFSFDVQKLCVAQAFGDVQLWASTQSYADAYFVLCRTAPRKAVKEALAATLEFVLVTGTFAADLKPALESDWDDVEDYLIAYSSRRIEADFVITRDEELAGKCPVKALTAAQFLAHMEEQEGLVYDEVPLP